MKWPFALNFAWIWIREVSSGFIVSVFRTKFDTYLIISQNRQSPGVVCTICLFICSCLYIKSLILYVICQQPGTFYPRRNTNPSQFNLSRYWRIPYSRKIRYYDTLNYNRIITIFTWICIVAWKFLKVKKLFQKCDSQSRWDYIVPIQLLTTNDSHTCCFLSLV